MVASELTASAKAMALGMIPSEGGESVGAAVVPGPLRNRAVESSNPFVQGLATSPVAWQPLDDATIERAKKEHKLIFMHIGYKACHHCRLMATESFANTECAAVLNEHFVPIALDRDECPHLDTIYMNYVQAVSNSGGWPLNLFLTPNLEPVFGGTYWPCTSTTRRVPGDGGEEQLDFLSIVKKVRNIWRDQEARCRKEATEVVAQLRDFAAEGSLGTRSLTATQSIAPINTTTSTPGTPSSTRKTTVPSELDLDQLEEAYTHIAGTFDPVYGGFGLAPKFVTSPKLGFLLRLSSFPGPVQDVVGETECQHATEMALTTLRRIRDGALRDHVGGTGFARFAITPDWTIPNFEKMVVDNALLLSLYVEAWQRSGGQEDSEFFDVVVELVNYLTESPIALPSGGFASSEAADSSYKRGDEDIREGAYHLWTRREFDSAVDSVDKAATKVAAAYFGVLEDGNVDEAHDPNDDFINQNILAVRRSPEDLSKQFSVPVQTVKEYIRVARAALKQKRDRDRPRPEVDEKVITGWNGLVISALARAASSLKSLRPELSSKAISAAKGAVDFIKSTMWDAERNILYRTYASRRINEGFADDYAYMVFGLLDLFDTTGDESFLEFADVLQKTQIALFNDPVAGGLFSTVADSPHTILRLKDGMDTALPSTNAISVSNLFQLGDLLADDKFTSLARETIDAFEAEVLQHPWLFPGLLAGVVAARLGVEKNEKDVKYRSSREKA